MGKSPYLLATASITRWAQNEPWRDRLETVIDAHLGEVLEKTDLTHDDLMELAGPDYPMIFGCIFEDFLTCDFEPDGENIVEDYLKRRGWKESPLGRKYLQAMRESTMSIYEVVDAVPGSHFIARDLVRGGEPVSVVDKLASENVVKWDRLAARLVELGDEVHMTGGVLPLEFDLADTLLADIANTLKRARRELAKEAKRAEMSLDQLDPNLMDAVLGEMAPLIVGMYVAGLVADEMNPSVPKLVDGEGEGLIFSEARFPLADPALAGEAASRIDRIPEVHRDDPSARSWSLLAPVSNESSLPGAPDTGIRLVLAFIELDGERVTVRTRSAKQAERCEILVAEALGTLIGPPLTATRTAEQALSNRSEQAPSASAQEPAVSPAEAKAVIRAMLDSHYRQTLSDPLPMLGGKSPMQAVRSKTGRQKVVDWLKYLENQTLRSTGSAGVSGYDVTWMWEELGIAHLRQ